MGELYGQFNDLTQEWVDGLASTMIRQAAMAELQGKKSWTVFDGPIDALWIEVRLVGGCGSCVSHWRKLCCCVLGGGGAPNLGRELLTPARACALFVRPAEHEHRAG
jgi:hypothetical protein